MSAPAPELYHAIRAELAIAAHSTDFRLEALNDAATRALTFFRLTDVGELESLSGETVGEWLERLRDQKPHYFLSSNGSPAEDQNTKPNRVIHGRVGDGQAMTRLAYSNGGIA